MDVPHTERSTWGKKVGKYALASRMSWIENAPDEAPARAVAIVGVPSDVGVSLNNGRAGAAGGPATFRQSIARWGSSMDALRDREVELPLFDAGDVDVVSADEPETSLEETHQRVREAFAALHRAGYVTLGIGGGHDLTAAMVAGAAEGRAQRNGAATSRQRFGGVNIDPHLDVRERLGSGMPFRRLIESDVVDPERFTTLGAARFTNRADHVRWLRERGGRIVTLDEARGAVVGQAGADTWAARSEESLRRAGVVGGEGLGFVSFDLDALDGSIAPGVSAVNAHGLFPAEAVAVSELAGRAPGVVHFDIMELNPRFDDNGRTARLAALIALHFLAGVSQREA